MRSIDTAAQLVRSIDTAAQLVRSIDAAAQLVRSIDTAAQLVRSIDTAAQLVRSIDTAAQLVRSIDTAAQLVWSIDTAAQLVRFEDECIAGAVAVRLEDELAAAKKAKLEVTRRSRQAVQASQLERSRGGGLSNSDLARPVVCCKCHTAVEEGTCFKNKPHRGDYCCKDTDTCGLRLDPDRGSSQPQRKRTRGACS